jgi:hypothetical protein
MSKKDDPIGVATSDGRIAVVLNMKGYSINEFIPGGALEPTEVHVLFDLAGEGPPLGFRLKSRRAIDELIAALQTHADGVWPKC